MNICPMSWFTVLVIIGHESIDASMSLGGVPPKTAKDFNLEPRALCGVDKYNLNERHKSQKGVNYIY